MRRVSTTRMRRSAAAAFSAVTVLAILFSSVPAQALTVIDQQFDAVAANTGFISGGFSCPCTAVIASNDRVVPGTNDVIEGYNRMAQTFIVSQVGLLKSFDLQVRRSTVFEPTDPLLVDIRQVFGVSPQAANTPLLASVGLLPASVPFQTASGQPASPAFVPVQGFAPIPVTTGDRFAIAMRASPDEPGQYNIHSHLTLFSPLPGYVDGNEFFSVSETGVWITSDTDSGFRTFVEAQVESEYDVQVQTDEGFEKAPLGGPVPVFRFNFPDTTPPVSDGILSLNASGDIGGSDGTVAVSAEGFPLGELFRDLTLDPAGSIIDSLIIPRDVMRQIFADEIRLSFSPADVVGSITYNSLSLTYTGLEAVSEPATLALLGAGLLGAGAMAWRGRRKG